MNFIHLTHIQFIFGIEDQLILSYNPKTPLLNMQRFFICKPAAAFYYFIYL
jgi:hypothetical protein